MRHIATLAALGALAAHAAAAEERRELSAHEHGRSVLNIAIEGDRVEMELMAPGMDIVGFEHAASSDEDKAAIAAAEETLQDALELFVMPEEAGCTVETAAVGLETEDDHDDHAEEAHAEEEHGDEAEHADAEHAEGEGSHTEFHAEYGITCASPDALGGVEFVFFDQFPGAEEIEVNVITENGQTSYDVERDAPRIDLKGLI